LIVFAIQQPREFPRAHRIVFDNDEVVKGIEHKLKCTCGCNLDIFTCRTTDYQFRRRHKEVMDLRMPANRPTK
jgi:hypothetical protein